MDAEFRDHSQAYLSSRELEEQLLLACREAFLDLVAMCERCDAGHAQARAVFGHVRQHFEAMARLKRLKGGPWETLNISFIVSYIYIYDICMYLLFYIDTYYTS